jgi:hypothetical protein
LARGGQIESWLGSACSRAAEEVSGDARRMIGQAKDDDGSGFEKTRYVKKHHNEDREWRWVAGGRKEGRERQVCDGVEMRMPYPRLGNDDAEKNQRNNKRKENKEKARGEEQQRKKKKKKPYLCSMYV